jgi:sulfhydrogenase subunit delta
MSTPKPKIAICKLASCDGCQLALLNLEEQLLDIAAKLDIAFFPEASSRMRPGPYDIAFVEGSVTSAEQAESVRAIRESSKTLVAIGACATAGGIQALRNWRDVKTLAAAVYANPDWLGELDASTPISAHVRVDYELNGCPVDKYQLLEALVSLLLGRTPQIPAHALCIECKRKGNVCVMVARGEPCLGPITHAGCGALCPSFDRGCYACFGPSESAQPAALTSWLEKRGERREELVRMLRRFTGYAPQFRSASDSLEKSA